MRISEIKNKLAENSAAIKELQSRIAKLSNENSALHAEKNSKLLGYFIDYIEIGSTYTFDRWSNLGGIQIGLKKDERPEASYFSTGDVIEFVKKNKVSFVIKWTIKNRVFKNKTEVSHPNKLYRIDIINLYTLLGQNETFTKSFDTFVKRKESLDLLGI